VWWQRQHDGSCKEEGVARVRVLMRTSRSRAPSMKVVVGAGARWCGAAGGFGLLRRVADTEHEGFASSSDASMEVFRQHE